LHGRGVAVGAYKPVASGCAEEGSGDADLLWHASGCRESIERVCPQRFDAAVAPPVAARLEGRTVDRRLLLDGARWWLEQDVFLVVEGAGGAMSPIADETTVLDVAAELQLPVVLIAANRLGVVNHTLLSLAAAAARGLSCIGVVLNNLPLASGQGYDLSLTSNRALLTEFLPESCRVVASIEELADRWLPSGGQDAG